MYIVSMVETISPVSSSKLLNERHGPNVHLSLTQPANLITYTQSNLCSVYVEPAPHLLSP